MNTIPSYDAEFLENRRYLELQVQLGHLRDQRPDGARTDTDGASEVGAGGTIEPAGPKIEIYDAERLARRLGHGDGFVGDPAEANNDEDAGQARQVRLWTKMHADERGPWRKLVIPNNAMIARLASLNAICPHFGEITAWIVRAANLAQATGTPLRLDPAVVVGPPGTGKTFYAGKLAEAMGVPFEVIAMNLMTDRGSAFSGLTPVWRASGPGKVAKLLVEGSHASPLIVIDEIEKASPINPRETPENVLHSLLERENATRFVDEFVDLPIRADHIFWFATANSLEPLSVSIVDRLIVFTIEPSPPRCSPSREASSMRRICGSDRASPSPGRNCFGAPPATIRGLSRVSGTSPWVLPARPGGDTSSPPTSAGPSRFCSPGEKARGGRSGSSARSPRERGDESEGEIGNAPRKPCTE